MPAAYLSAFPLAGQDQGSAVYGYSLIAARSGAAYTTPTAWAWVKALDAQISDWSRPRNPSWEAYAPNAPYTLTTYIAGLPTAVVFSALENRIRSRFPAGDAPAGGWLHADKIRRPFPPGAPRWEDVSVRDLWAAWERFGPSPWPDNAFIPADQKSAMDQATEKILSLYPEYLRLRMFYRAPATRDKYFDCRFYELTAAFQKGVEQGKIAEADDRFRAWQSAAVAYTNYQIQSENARSNEAYKNSWQNILGSILLGAVTTVLTAATLGALGQLIGKAFPTSKLADKVEQNLTAPYAELKTNVLDPVASISVPANTLAPQPTNTGGSGMANWWDEAWNKAQAGLADSVGNLAGQGLTSLLTGLFPSPATPSQSSAAAASGAVPAASDPWATFFSSFSKTPAGAGLVTGATNSQLGAMLRSPWTWAIAVAAVLGLIFVVRKA